MTDKNDDWFATRGLLKSNYRNDDKELVEKCLLDFNEWLEAIGCDKAYSRYMKDTYKLATGELNAQLAKAISIIRKQQQAEDTAYYAEKMKEAIDRVRVTTRQAVAEEIKGEFEKHLVYHAIRYDGVAQLHLQSNPTKSDEEWDRVWEIFLGKHSGKR